MFAKKFLVPALSLVAAFTVGSAAANAAGGRCQSTLALSNWSSEPTSDGTYLHRVLVRNLTHGMVSATVSYNGVGAIPFRKTLQPNASAMADIARTVAPIGQDVLSKNTVVGCNIVG